MRKRPVEADGTLALAEVVRDPVRFARGLLRLDVWPVQEAILRAVATERRTGVKACHSALGRRWPFRRPGMSGLLQLAITGPSHVLLLPANLPKEALPTSCGSKRNTFSSPRFG